MASVFLSYDRDDADKARAIAAALEGTGHEVWWDLHVRSGAQFSKVIEEALQAADAVVVLWSKQAVESAWVRDEAAAGRDTGRLVPITIDGTQPPLGFRQFQTIDLSRWKGRGNSAELRMLLADVAAMGTPLPKYLPGTKPSALPSRKRKLTGLLAAGAGVGAVVVGSLLWWQPWGHPGTPVVAVTAADSSPNSTALARDLLVQLGKLQATNPDSLKLVGGVAEHPGLILEASASDQAQTATAGLVLLGGRNRTLLWSRDYSQPRERQPDLRQQVAYSAAQVLRCAGEAMSAEEPLKEDLRKLYLNGCAEFGQATNEDTSVVIGLFEKVAEGAPNFRPAWAKLLIASDAAVGALDPWVHTDPDPREALRRHIAQAARRFPDLPEILLAKSDLLPLEAYSDRMDMVDRAKRLASSNASVLKFRSQELSRVGRMDEALQDAQRAFQLDPLSPALCDSLISALAYSGELTSAQEALTNAQHLWPGSSSVLDAQFRFHLRYGDPHVALEISRKRAVYRGSDAFLEARIDPSPDKIEQAVKAARSGAMWLQDFSFLAQTLAEFHREAELFPLLLDWKTPLARSGFEVLFRPQFNKFREDPRFIQIAKKAGLLDYWRTSGHWPDFCFEPNLSYDCKKEAAKFAA